MGRLVLQIEAGRLEEGLRPDLAREVRWVSDQDGDGAGYDIRSFDSNGNERFIEVKTTNGAARTPFFLSHNECETSIEFSDKWCIYRVHLFAANPRIFVLSPPLEGLLFLKPEIWRASFS